MKKVSLIVASLALVLLASCGSSSSETQNADNDSLFNDDDVMFAQMMIPHHEQAIEMADIALDPSVGASAEIVSLATQIKNAQDPEISQMMNLLTKWSMPMSADADMDHGSSMDGMLSIAELDELATLTGSEFDTRWALAMIAHHEGALAMANEVLASGSNAEISALARLIVEGQTSEIETLRLLANNVAPY